MLGVWGILVSSSGYILCGVYFWPDYVVMIKYWVKYRVESLVIAFNSFVPNELRGKCRLDL